MADIFMVRLEMKGKKVKGLYNRPKGLTLHAYRNCIKKQVVDCNVYLSLPIVLLNYKVGGRCPHILN